MATQTEVPRVPAPQAGASPSAHGRLSDAAVIGVPAIVAFVLCLVELTSRSLWLDEAATVAIAGQHGAAFWSAAAHDGGNMLGYYAVLHALIGWFGDGAFVIRLPSVIASGAAAGAVSLLGLRLFDRRVALAAGLLTAVSLPLVFWGQDARGYAAMVALVAGSFVAFAGIVDGPRRRGPWVAYVVLTTLSVYASYVAIFAVAAQLVALAAFHRHAWRRATTAVAACGVCWIPLAVLAISRGSNQLFWIARPNLTAAKQVALALTSAGFEPNFHPTAASTVLAIATAALLLLAAVRIVREPRWGAVLALSWLVVPVGLMLIWSFVGQPIFTARGGAVAGLGSASQPPLTGGRVARGRGPDRAPGGGAHTELRHLARELACRHRLRAARLPARRLRRVLPARRVDAVRLLRGRAGGAARRAVRDADCSGRMFACVARREPPGLALRHGRVTRTLRPLRVRAGSARSSLRAPRDAVVRLRERDLGRAVLPLIAGDRTSWRTASRGGASYPRT
jgi:hypothetical protein